MTITRLTPINAAAPTTKMVRFRTPTRNRSNSKTTKKSKSTRLIELQVQTADADLGASESPWKVDTPFGPPRISHLHFPGGIRRIRNTFAKLTPAARAERELLRQKNLYKIPLTERNVDTFVTHQEFNEACFPNRHSNEVTVCAWLERLI
ncbi:uncharacterized protein BDV17DRAFT_211479 [Aspergillus undulatus]|uniref:uncharacterized protein n=1 Tax=Aspergillus undulatus TaxID=1810928 RepID=UPI003CCD31CE